MARKGKITPQEGEFIENNIHLTDEDLATRLCVSTDTVMRYRHKINLFKNGCRAKARAIREAGNYSNPQYNLIYQY